MDSILLRGIRARSDILVIIITGDRQDEFDCVVELGLRADDCVIEPFDLGKLLTRVRTVTRRCNASQWHSVKSRRVFIGCRLESRWAQPAAYYSGRKVLLTKREYALLFGLIRDGRCRDHLFAGDARP
jgi:two-component system, OmpR family, response regulator